MVRTKGLPVFLRRSSSSEVLRLKSLRERMSLAMSSMASHQICIEFDDPIGQRFGQPAGNRAEVTVAVGVPLSTADPGRSGAAGDVAWRQVARVPEENRRTANDLDLRLTPVTPEAAGSSPVDPANLRSRLPRGRELRLASHAKVVSPKPRQRRRRTSRHSDSRS